MTDLIYTDPSRRHDFVLLFDVADGNPNGDPDAGNLPRVDPETMKGLVTDVAIKRKVRDWIDLLRGRDAHYKIYIQSEEALNTLHKRAYTERNQAVPKNPSAAEVDAARQWMCQNFYDVRMFGAVMTTGVNAGQVRGPLQLTFARSIDPIVPLEVAITRIAITREEDRQGRAATEGDEGKAGKRTEMGRKALIPYGLYRAHGFFNPHFAARTGVTAEDLALFWQALVQMWELDRSAARGMMACRGVYIFTHESGLGNAAAHRLFERVVVAPRSEVAATRQFADYTVTVREDDLPAGVTLTTLDG
jgi:CRISPR-associated protein Csd2